MISQVRSQVLQVVYIFYRSKISIHFQRVCYLSKPKTLSNGILNAHNIIRTEGNKKIST